MDDRRCFAGILGILWTGAQWRELPRRYGSPSTCWRRLQQWEETGVLLKLWRAFLAQLNDQEKLRWDACVADGRFIPAKRGDLRSARPNAARVQGGWLWSMARGPPLGAYLDAASPAEVTLLEPTLETIAVPRNGPGRPRKNPERVIYDKA